jgi:hypothetical protein
MTEPWPSAPQRLVQNPPLLTSIPPRHLNHLSDLRNLQNGA